MPCCNLNGMNRRVIGATLPPWPRMEAECHREGVGSPTLRGKKETGGAPIGAPPVRVKSSGLFFEFLQRGDHVVERGLRRCDRRIRVHRFFREFREFVDRLYDTEEDHGGFCGESDGG